VRFDYVNRLCADEFHKRVVSIIRLDAMAYALARRPGESVIRTVCQRAARLGVRRDPCEGPSDFSTRAAQLLPNESQRIREISTTYIALRYAPQPVGVAIDRFAKEVRAFATRRSGWRGPL
jgi:hypothetical protein